jgi:nitroimidazol reductase NimA-like FMN-containing flavoprotein (pyridoxamine 5'-phosphate oxidase superfamily)
MSVTELQSVGISPMDDGEIEQFLASQGVGVLGLPADAGPYLVPISFGFDGDDCLYFTYVGSDTSRKVELSDRAERGRFLVYSAPTKFSWQSVSLAGPLTAVAEAEWSDIEDAMDNAWHPDVFDTRELQAEVAVYRFEIREQVGLKQTEVPPTFRDDGNGERV